jgi:hypothetical protein
MLVALIERSGKSHILAYKATNGSYSSICGHRFPKLSMINVISIDSTFAGMCVHCKKQMDSIIDLNLKYAPRYARSRTQMKLESTYDGNKFNYRGPQVDYGDVFYRYWPRLNRYMNLVNKSSKKLSRKKFFFFA